MQTFLLARSRDLLVERYIDVFISMSVCEYTVLVS